MSRIPHGSSPAKFHAIPCCKCRQPHPEDPTTGRMAEHSYLGRKCLGGDIPFRRHGDPPMGKLVGCIVSRDPMPCRTHVISLARRDGIDERVIDALVAKSDDRDVTIMQWMRRLITLLQGTELRGDAPSARRAPRLRLVRERRVRA